MTYDNMASPISETTRTFDSPLDLTTGEADRLEHQNAPVLVVEVGRGNEYPVPGLSRLVFHRIGDPRG